jgi:hypothetical protein
MNAIRPFVILAFLFFSKASFGQIDFALSAGYDTYYEMPVYGLGVVYADQSSITLNLGFGDGLTTFGGEANFSLFHFSRTSSFMGGVGFGVTRFGDDAPAGATDLYGRLNVGLHFRPFILTYGRSFVFPNEFSVSPDGGGNFFNLIVYF